MNRGHGMYIRYDDILSRIIEKPVWWLDGVPRFEPFRPNDLDVHAGEALLVHVRCQSCLMDYHLGLWNPQIAGARSFRERLSQHRHIGLGDPPNACCGVGATMTVEEVAVLEFWEFKGNRWVRVPELERGLWTSDVESAEQHEEAWRRIHLYDDRKPGNRPAWRLLLEPDEFTSSLPPERFFQMPEPVGSIDLPKLNTRRRLALMALRGQLSQDEYDVLKHKDQRDLAEFERRMVGERPAWAAALAGEVRDIDDFVLSHAIPGYASMSPAEREVLFCHGLRRRLAPLAATGRITHREYRDVLDMLQRGRYSL